MGVFLTYATAQGRVLLDRELYLPQVWADDGERRREAGVPEEVTFRTKPQLAQDMLGRAVESGVPFSWVTGDDVYGTARNLDKLRGVCGRLLCNGIKCGFQIGDEIFHVVVEHNTFVVPCWDFRSTHSPTSARIATMAAYLEAPAAQPALVATVHGAL